LLPKPYLLSEGRVSYKFSFEQMLDFSLAVKLDVILLIAFCFL
jgi:hypothetical protein